MSDTNPAYELFERAVNKRRLSNRIASVVVTMLSVVGVVWGLSETGDRSRRSVRRTESFGSMASVKRSTSLA